MKFVGRIAWYSLLVVSSTPQVALAQGDGDGGAGADWVKSYFLVLLCVGLGLLIICRPGKRGKEVKRDQ
jgi:hypothetical protein